MSLFSILLLISTLLCTLATGFILTYAIVVMPGLAKLEDKEFVRAFQVTDKIIQNNQPAFMLIWVGSIISVVAMMISAFLSPESTITPLIIAVGAVYLIGMQGLTIFIHIPLNNHIQKLKINELNDQLIQEQRGLFEHRWNYYNRIRTVIGVSVSLSLMGILMMQ